MRKFFDFFLVGIWKICNFASENGWREPLKGNRVRIPDSPAAVILHRIRQNVTDPTGLGRRRETEISPNTHRFSGHINVDMSMYVKEIFRGKDYIWQSKHI